MKINLKKTNVMRVSTNEGSKNEGINIDGVKPEVKQEVQNRRLQEPQRDKETYSTRKRSLQQEQRAPAGKLQLRLKNG